MRKLMIVPLVCLWALTVTWSLTGQEKAADKAEKKEAAKSETGAAKERAAAEKSSPEARLKELMQQMEKMQRALAEERKAFSSGDFNEKQQKMAADMQKLTEEVRRQMQQRGSFPLGGPQGGPGGQFAGPVGGVFGGPGAPAGGPNGPFGAQGGAFDPQGDPSQMALRQMKHMLQSLDQSGGALARGGAGIGDDPVEIGQMMVIAGLEVQLKGLAQRINATEDKEAKQKLTGELHEIVEQVVDGRKKHRERTIQQLEKRLAELKKNAEKDESVDQMVQRLLDTGKEDEKAAADEGAIKEAQKPEAKSSK